MSDNRLALQTWTSLKMPIQRIDYTPDKKSCSSVWGHIFLWCSIFFALGWNFFGNPVVAGVVCVVGIFPAAFSVLWAHNLQSKSRFKLVRSHFISKGYRPDFELKPMLLIDSQARKLAYFNNAGNWYELMDLGDIRGWEHTWVDHAEANTNVWGDRIIGRTTQRDNVLVLKTNNPHQPLYKIHLRHYGQGELWMARFSALMNG